MACEMAVTTSGGIGPAAGDWSGPIEERRAMVAISFMSIDDRK